MDTIQCGIGGKSIAGMYSVSSAVTARAVVIVSADGRLRKTLRESLMQMRWVVREVAGGAEAMASLEQECPEAMIVDGWLPDLEAGEFVRDVERMFPGIDLLRTDGSAEGKARSARRNELLHAIRMVEQVESNSWVDAAMSARTVREASEPDSRTHALRKNAGEHRGVAAGAAIAEMVGESVVMLELAKMIRLVAPRSATVLIEGETGTGKEVVAKALHRLSARASKPFVVLNCAAIPESLLEAELFGHTRGAFTGAVQSRTGRIEAAHGGTLFLDEIGEMPLALQAKMLRFLECGELQKVGDNEPLRVDVRVIAATHQELERRAEEKTFRLDLYHRLAVFPLEVPALRDRMEDLPALVEHFLEQMGRDFPRKTIAPEAMVKLRGYAWPGNVRELMHVLERAAILAEDRAQVGCDEIRLRGVSTRH